MSKLSLSRAWEEAASVLSRDGRLLLPVALALFVLPGLVLSVSMPAAPAGKLPPAGAWIAIAIASLLVSLVGQLAVIRLALGRHVSVGEAISHGFRRLLPYVVAVLAWVLPLLIVGSLLYAYLGPVADAAEGERVTPGGGALIASLGLMVLTVIGMYLAVRLMLSSAVASAEPLGPIAILKRSWHLSRGNWWRLFVFLLLVGVGAICLLWAVESVVGLLASIMFDDIGPRTLGGLLVALVSQVISAIISVVFFVLLARIYAQRSGVEEAEVSVPNSGT